VNVVGEDATTIRNLPTGDAGGRLLTGTGCHALYNGGTEGLAGLYDRATGRDRGRTAHDRPEHRRQQRPVGRGPLRRATSPHLRPLEAGLAAQQAVDLDPDPGRARTSP